MRGDTPREEFESKLEAEWDDLDRIERLNRDLARANARAEAWRTFATHMAECKSGCCELGAVLWNDARRLEEGK